MRRREKVDLRYVKTKSGKIYVSLDDIVDILENRILTGKTPLPDLIDELINKRPSNTGLN